MSDPGKASTTLPSPTGIIVVGVDGSDSSKQALLWAARQAGLTGAKLRAVMTWELPSLVYLSPVVVEFDLPAETRKTLDSVIGEVLGSAPVDLEPVVREGRPAPALIEESRHADLLVIGSRGHGEFAGMLLGSVSQHCVAHAECPVVVIRTARHVDAEPSLPA